MGNPRRGHASHEGTAVARGRGHEELVALLRRLNDPEERVVRATALLDDLKRAIDDVSRIRERAVVELCAGGWSYAAIADIAGLSKGRVAQIVGHARR